MKSRQFAAVLVAATLAAAIVPGRAAAIAVNSFANGLYDTIGAFESPIVSTSTGPFNSFRSFFAFDLTGVAPAAGASITFFGNNGNLGIFQGDLTLELYAFAGNLDALVDGSGGVTAFNQLGSGTPIGRYTFPGPVLPQVNMPEFTVDLSVPFVSLLGEVRASADPRIALGGVATGEGVLWDRSFMLPAAQLNITEASPSQVSEPVALGLFGLGATLLLIARRRHGQRATRNRRATR